MRTRISTLFLILASVSSACDGSTPEKSEAKAPVAPATPVAPVAAPTPSAPPPEFHGYPVCDRAPSGDSKLGTSGDPGRQLAPLTADKMVDCRDEDESPPEAIAVAAAGKLNEKGDCVWENGVSCHFHVGVEFTDPAAPAATGTNELHCIFPLDADKNSPDVFGEHFTCKAGTSVKTAHGTHGAAGSACGAGLLPALRASEATCDEGVRCCDEGTLTKPYDSQTPEEHALRPDFHICPKAVELDCTLLTGMEPHSAFAEGSAGHHEEHAPSADKPALQPAQKPALRPAVH